MRGQGPVRPVRPTPTASFKGQGTLWDLNELYDLQNDPQEKQNLIASSEHQELVQQLNGRLFAVLSETGGAAMPLKPDRGPTFPLRRRDRGRS